MNVSTLNYFLALGTVAMQIVTVVLLGAFLLRKKVPALQDVVSQVSSYGLWILFATAFVVSGMTLYYESIGFAPCPLCWWQRVALYPQVGLFAMGLWCRQYLPAAIDFSIFLSIAGAAVALYHHALQMLPGSGLPCPATGVSCAQRIFFELDYVTYPLMAFSVFAFLIVILLIVRSRQ